MMHAELHQLNALIKTVDDVLPEGNAAFADNLLADVRSALDAVQRQVNTTTQRELIDDISQDMDRQQSAILMSLEVPLKSLRRLAQKGELSDSQKARLLIQLGKTHDVLAQWNVAMDDLYQALDFCTSSSIERAEALMRLGHLKSKQKEYSIAQQLYRESMQICEQLDEMEMLMNIQICLGYNAFEQGNYAEAEQCCTDMLTRAEAEGCLSASAQASQALGILHTVKGNFDTAMEHYQRCLNTYEELEDWQGIAGIYHNLAMLYTDQQRWAEAGDAYEKSLEHAENVGDMELVGLVHLNRIELAFKMFDLALAEASCRHAMRVFAQMGSRGRLAEVYKYYGMLYARRKEWSQAGIAFSHSIQIFKELGDRLNQAEARHVYGNMLAQQGKQEDARQQLDTALFIFTELGASQDIVNVKRDLDVLVQTTAEKPLTRPIRRIRRIGKSDV